LAQTTVRVRLEVFRAFEADFVRKTVFTVWNKIIADFTSQSVFCWKFAIFTTSTDVVEAAAAIRNLIFAF